MIEESENIVKKTCRELGITQTELADMLGVSRQSINNWANGRTDPPKIFSRLIELVRIEKKFIAIKEQLTN